MDLTEDTIKEICGRMDIDSLYNFIQTSQQNQNLCMNIYNLKYYEEIEYPQLVRLYEVKQKILKKLNKLDAQYILLVISADKETNGLQPDEFGFLYTKRRININNVGRTRYVNIPGYSHLFIDGGQLNNNKLLYPDMYNQIIYIMSTEDPDIRLQQLRQLV